MWHLCSSRMLLEHRLVVECLRKKPCFHWVASYMSRAEHDDFFLDSLCLMWALCCLSDVMNITMAAVPFEIWASHSICSPKNAWYNCWFQRGSQPCSFCGGLRARFYKQRRYNWFRDDILKLYAVFFLWSTKREIIN